MFFRKKSKILGIEKSIFKWIIIGTLIIFFCVNSVDIRQGMCVESPCNNYYEESINQSEWVNIGYDDRYLVSETFYYLSPTVFLLPKVFNSDLYMTDSSDSFKFAVDYKKDPIENKNGKISHTDPTNFTNMFLIIKFIVLLSFPIWIAISYIVVMLYNKNKKLGISIGVLFFIPIILIKILNLIGSLISRDYITISHLFVQNIYLWIIFFIGFIAYLFITKKVYFRKTK